MKFALDGLKVLCLAGTLPGPYCSMFLADMGAEVVMLERPGVGDPGRLFPGIWETINRNKKSITVNLQSKRGLEVCHRLVRASDVIIEGFRPGVAKRLKVDFETCKAIKPDIIYASISGYGQDGPYRDLPGHDTNYQAIAGMLINEGRIVSKLPHIRTADLSSGMFAAIGILAALRYRDRTGEGQFIDISMTDGLLSWKCIELYQHLNEQKVRRVVEPGHNTFETRDGKYLSLGIVHEDNLWANLCRAIGKPELADMPRSQRLERKEELSELLTGMFLTRDRDEWFALLRNANVPTAPAYVIEEVSEDPHFRHRKMFPELQTDTGVMRQVANPVKFSSCSTDIRTPPPGIGEHTADILRGLGYSEHEIEELRREGAV